METENRQKTKHRYRKQDIDTENKTQRQKTRRSDRKQDVVTENKT